LTKCYIEESKYSSEGDNFALKLKIFLDTYKRVGLPSDSYRDAFPIMLKGLALDYYYLALLDVKDTLPFQKLCQDI